LLRIMASWLAICLRKGERKGENEEVRGERWERVGQAVHSPVALSLSIRSNRSYTEQPVHTPSSRVLWHRFLQLPFPQKKEA